MTPFSQMLLAQAVMNVTGKERYATIPDEVIRYALGKSAGKCADRAAVIDRIDSLPRTRELRQERRFLRSPSCAGGTRQRSATKKSCFARRCFPNKWMPSSKPVRRYKLTIPI